MTWQVIARTDSAVTAGPRSVKLLLALPVLTILAAAYVYPVIGEDPITTARFAGFVSGWITTVVPLAGVLLGYNAVVSERESGSLLLTLSLPHSRRDVVFGKFAGRAGLVCGTLLGAMVAAAFLVVYPFGDLTPLRFAAFVVVTTAFGAAWTGIGVAASLLVATRRRALAVAFGSFFLFVLVWRTVRDAVELGLREAGLVDSTLPQPIEFAFSLEPGSVYGRVTAGFVDPSAAVEGPWYLGEWVALVVLALWVVGPMGLAYRRFAGSDLA